MLYGASSSPWRRIIVIYDIFDKGCTVDMTKRNGAWVGKTSKKYHDS